MTEEKIERYIEAIINSYDRQLMSGKITQERYDAAMAELNRWAAAQYAILQPV